MGVLNVLVAHAIKSFKLPIFEVDTNQLKTGT